MDADAWEGSNDGTVSSVDAGAGGWLRRLEPGDRYETTQGQTVEDALDDLREATMLFVEEFSLPVTGRPFLTSFHLPEHA